MLAALPDVAANLKNWLRLHGLLGYLREQAFLGFMSAPGALTYLDLVQPATFDALRTVQAEGLGDDRWYFLQSGEVCLHPAEGDTTLGPRELGPGACFGEQALRAWGGRVPTAVTLSSMRCLCLPRDRFAGFDPTRVSGQQSRKEFHLTQGRKAYVWIGQQEEADCGLAALAMVGQFHGLKVSVNHLRQSLVIPESGVSLLELQRLALGLGLGCLPVRVSNPQLDQVAIPAIAHYRGGHYVVLYEVGANGVVVGDPAAGIVRLSQELFVQRWSGNLLLIRPQKAS